MANLRALPIKKVKSLIILDENVKDARKLFKQEDSSLLLLPADKSNIAKKRSCRRNNSIAVYATGEPGSARRHRHVQVR